MTSEAHLDPGLRSVALVRWLRAGKRRTYWGWALTIAFVVLNELRGVYVVAEFLKTWTQA